MVARRLLLGGLPPDRFPLCRWKVDTAWCIACTMNVNDYDLKLEELQRRATVRLLASDSFDAAAFNALREHICRKAKELRNEYVISKQILKCLREASGAIRNQAEHVAAVREHLPVANDFEMLLDLLIAGEGSSDRQPGVPRII